MLHSTIKYWKNIHRFSWFSEKQQPKRQFFCSSINLPKSLKAYNHEVVLIIFQWSSLCGGFSLKLFMIHIVLLYQCLRATFSQHWDNLCPASTLFQFKKIQIFQIFCFISHQSYSAFFSRIFIIRVSESWHCMW